jgi:hypothetical protein
MRRRQPGTGDIMRSRPGRVVALALATFLASCSERTGPDTRTDLLDRLNALPGVQAREIQPHYGYPKAFQLDITQPVDHDHPGASFTQRAYLSHVDASAPMVFAPSGYGASPESGQELAWILGGNCLSVVHRYFPDSRPTPMDWQYLNLRQAAEDHHRIVTLLKEVYTGRWVSAGSSKGGETVLFHRRFHPEDVDATVAYVAPLLFSDDDPRFMPYLHGLETDRDTAAIHTFQRALLERKADLLDDYAAWFTGHGYTFSLPLPSSFESAVVSYEWEFWQRHIFDAADVPGPDAPDAGMIDHLAQVIRLHFDADVYRDYFQAYVYQTRTEIGHPHVDADHLADLLVEPPLDIREAYGFPPDMEFVYRPEVIADVLDWIQTRGDRIILIYGELDPWTGGAIELKGTTDALKVVQAGADHQVKIADLDRRDEVLARLGQWLGMVITLPAGAPPLADRDLPPRDLRAMPPAKF